MNTNRTARPQARGGSPRRGILLLLVLSVLALFLLMGTLAIVMATRARETSIAFAAATGGGRNNAVLGRQLTDEALMMLVRGTKDTKVQALLGGQKYDCLLKDMYGTSNTAFADEAYDAFDDANPFLTQVALDGNGRITGAPRPAFSVAANAAAAEVDNDGDGTADGIWLPKQVPQAATDARFFPTLSTRDGNILEFRVSYLVLDLDARANVNAHGRPAGDNPDGGANRVYGPADVNLAEIVGDTAAGLILGGGTLQGWDDTRWLPSLSMQGRRPPDLPQQPVDSKFGSSGCARTYDLKLNLEASRPSLLAAAPGQNPFAFGELERVLRFYDADASTLPPRLAAVLGDRGERCRALVTTDSWDRPGSVPSLFTATVGADASREPGRINANTCDRLVWKAMLSRDIANPFSTAPAKTVNEMLTKQGLVYPNPNSNDRDDEVYRRLQGMATIRSNVFAVWITLEITDKSANADPPSYHRMFAIVDRSIPVQYSEGQNTDARKTIRLLRFLN